MNRKFSGRISEFIQYILFRIICFLVNLLPFTVALKLGKWGGRQLYRLLSRHRTVALDNLRFVFGKEKSESEIKTLAVQSFENLGMFGVEFIRIPQVVKRMKDFIVIENEEAVFKALEQKRGVILIVSHFGNWEWMGVAAGARVREIGVKINAVARPLGNPFLYRYAVEKLRGATGLKTIHKKGAAREVLDLLDQNQIVCILIDQHERYGSVAVPYFGRKAMTTALPAMLAVKKNVPILPVFSYRSEHGPTVVKLGNPFATIKTDNYEQDLCENTKQYIQAIEREARNRPSDWLWMHRRWR